ncbi:MAG: plasmid mobilization relaxosome protein MobC, partial [Lachnospira sp.]|nr:plasmid mobilization relaxosome protein MobC [Lachnospira sp.]
YLRKMAIDGYIIYTDIKNIKQYIQELQAIGRNINQIAKRVNSTSDIYKEDIEEIKERLDEIWLLQRSILSNLR